MTLDAQLAALLARCSHDEKRVILVQLTRMDKAREKLGPLDLARDPRDWLKEAAAEIVDLGFYVSALLLANDYVTASRPTPPGAAEAGPAGGEAGDLSTYCLGCGAKKRTQLCTCPPAITRAPAVEIGEGE